MDSSLILAAVVGLVIGALAGALAVWSALTRTLVAARHEAAQLSGSVATLQADNQALRSSAATQRELSEMIAPVRESLENLRRASDTASQERTKAEATLTTQIAAVQERYQSLETATKQVAAALSRGQTRGQWGEMQLEGLLSHAGLLEGTHYRRQDSRASGETSTRPDVVVLLPGGGQVVVDAKFPFDAYWAAVGTEDPGQREVLMAKHAADVLQRARELSSRRYSETTVSPDFVVMFLPLESLLASALESDGLLLERTFERKVILATPTTMLALLRTIGFGYQRELMAENAEEIKAAGAEMLTRLGILVEHVEVMRRGLEQAVRGYNKFVGSFDTHALRQARRLAELGVDSQRGLEPPDVIDTEPRSSAALSATS